MLSGGRSPLLGSKWGSRGGDHFHFGARERPLGRVTPQKKRLSGGPFGAPNVALEGPSAILEIHWFSMHFEPLYSSGAAKETKKNAKWWTLMQVKSRRYQERRRKWQLLQNQKRSQGAKEKTKNSNQKLRASLAGGVSKP